MENNIILETNYEHIKAEMFDIVRLFYPTLKCNIKVTHSLTITDEKIINECEIIEGDKVTTERTENTNQIWTDALTKKRTLKRYSKLCIYKTISKHLDTNLPWGSLTGIRPTKLAYDLIKEGVPDYIIRETLMKHFLVSEPKATLVQHIINNQNCIIKNDNLIDLYINIPICPTRCIYCSFISSELAAVEKIIPTYLECLIKEIREVKKLIFDKAYVVRTIYIGGGTPTSLTAEQLSLLLEELNYPVNEFTVECGRPDTITAEKLEVLKKNGVTRICINPQSFNQKTLKAIGRNHTIKDILEAYKLAINYDFDINMDLIAGLPGEKFTHFKKSIDTTLELAPHNITVHTLSIKQGAKLCGLDEVESTDKEVVKMINYANKKLTENSYKPYYLYRQKNQIDGLENVGYMRDNKICIFNVDSMEETCSVIACGANAISKRIYNIENRIERQANVKFLHDYIRNIDDLIKKKKDLFS